MPHEHPPQPRHVSLQPFSRDHYVGLVQAERLRKAADAQPADTPGSDAAARRKAVSEFLDAWRQEIAEHFEDEERLLDALLTDPERTELHQQHHHLRALAEEAPAPGAG